MQGRLRRRSFLLQVVGSVVAGGALGTVAPTWASTEPGADLRGTGVTDRDRSDRACFGRGRGGGGVSDSDPVDPVGHGRGTGITDRDSADRACFGRGARTGSTGISDSDPTDPAGAGRGGSRSTSPAPSPSPPPPPSPQRDDDPVDASGSGRAPPRPGRTPPGSASRPTGVTDSDAGLAADPAGRGRGRGQASNTIPSFPWPPPQPSQRLLLPREPIQAAVGANASVHTVGRRLEQALDRAGYGERSVYSAPNGVAIVSRLERIHADGRPAGDNLRYLPPGREPFSLSAYLGGLFVAPVGYFRMIVFVVTSQAVVPSREQLTQEGAAGMLARGADRLPGYLRKIPFSPSHEVVALIYEFEKVGARRPLTQVNPGRLDARAHLARAGLAPLLVR